MESWRMNKEEPMRVYVVESRFEGDMNNLTITDVPSVPFLNCRNPLYIGVKTGQVKRMRNNIKNEKLGGTALGFWEMLPYVSRKGKVNFDEFKKHDVVFLASPERCHEQFKELYSELVKVITSSL
jgi:hypothetical protein